MKSDEAEQKTTILQMPVVYIVRGTRFLLAVLERQPTTDKIVSYWKNVLPVPKTSNK